MTVSNEVRAGETISTNLVNLSNILQRVDLVDLNLELTRLKHAEKLIGIVVKLLAGFDVAEEGGTSNLNTLGREFPV